MSCRLEAFSAAKAVVSDGQQLNERPLKTIRQLLRLSGLHICHGDFFFIILKCLSFD